MNSTTQDKLKALRAAMKKVGVKGFIVPRADEFQGEFIAPYAARLPFLTGFTGSGGFVIVLAEKAAVFTDGRYMIQIRRQVDAQLFEIVDMTKISAGQWLSKNAENGHIIGYDPWLHTARDITKIEENLAGLDIGLKALDQNLIDQIWEGQPAPPQGAVELFPDEAAGKTSAEKRREMAGELREGGALAALIAAPDSLCWLLNVRGSDVDFSPLVLSYALLHAKEEGAVDWFVAPSKVPETVRNHLGADVRIVAPSPAALERAMEDLAQEALARDKAVRLDSAHAPVWFKHRLESRAVKIDSTGDPCILPKACKNAAEQKSLREAHIRDGAALVKFLHWFEEEGGRGGYSEWDIAEKLEKIRQENSPAYCGPSFPTIAGFGENGAVIHYRAQKESAAVIKPPGVLLLDSGGQYRYGTTDITRTIAAGDAAQEIKVNFTRVLKGHIALAMARFPEGTTGAQIDVLARAPLWNVALDYAHGTGHGVGCYLQVHEEAAPISPRGREAFKAGMLLSNEPGYYEEGAYGIRIENLVLVREAENCSTTGQSMLYFETVSLAPIDWHLIVTAMLSQEERLWLDEYHKNVWEKLSPHLEGPALAWLKAQTRPL